MAETSIIPYRITVIEQKFATNKTGKLEQVKSVHYEAATGDTGNITIPVDNFSADLAASMIEGELAEIAKLRGM